MSRLGILTSAGAAVALCANLAFAPQAAAHGTNDDLARALVGIIALGVIAKSLDDRRDRHSHRVHRYNHRPDGLYKHHSHRHHGVKPRHYNRHPAAKPRHYHRHKHKYRPYGYRKHRGHHIGHRSSPFYYGR